jgi:hypothetical protein
MASKTPYWPADQPEPEESNHNLVIISFENNF